MMDRIKGWETKAMRRLFRFERKEDETLRMMDKDGDGGKNELEKDEAPFFFSEMLVESVWRAMGWTCHTRTHAVLTTLKYSVAWRSTAWWQNTKSNEYEG